ncbi:MAG: aspartate aminotransferase family protein [Gammaproteobacteria bacterium]
MSASNHEPSATLHHAESERLAARARRVFPGGTTRATVRSQPFPIYAQSGAGPYLIDVDGHRYLDLNNNFTTLIHGHCFAPIVEAVTRAARTGTCFANPTALEIELAELIIGRVPGIETLRFVNTGTEAVMFAIKAARAVTGRAKIAKFEGAYHGSYDWAEVSEAAHPGNWGRAEQPLSSPPYAGTPPSVLEEVVVVPFNDIARTRALIERHAAELACVLIDLMPGRAGLVPIESDYLHMLREVTRRHGILLIDDEVLNFRQAYEGAAHRFGVQPDLVTFGKIIGGGLPIGAIGGPRALMDVFSASDTAASVPQSGTFSANPVSMGAGLACMRALTREAFAHLESLGDYARAGLQELFRRKGWPFSVTGQASLLRVHARPIPPRSYREAHPTPPERAMLANVAEGLLARGFIAPTAASWSFSTPMTRTHIDDLIAACADIPDPSATTGSHSTP